MKPITLTGIKPTGAPHLGNYLGMIHPALELVERYEAYYFVADYHALTFVRDRQMLMRYTHEIAAAWLALGLDPDRAVFYRQSDVPEIFEFTWILSCFTAKGLLNRAHAYKAAADVNEAAGRSSDDGVNAGLYNYPVLMAADILLFCTDVVPVGLDQKQHIEIARDVAAAFNANYGDVLTLPEALIQPEVAAVPGLDGRKMSKSYHNTIEVFAPPEVLRKQVMRIVTDSKRPEDPKNPDECNIFAIYRHFASPDAIERTRQRYLQGGLAYGELKQELFELLDERFCEPRERYNQLMADPGRIDRILLGGAEKARTIAIPMMQKVRERIGIGMEVVV